MMLQTRQAVLALVGALLCCSHAGVQAQENAQLAIPPSLVECYNTTYFQNRDNRLPSNINTLISLIEKVENSYGFNQDIRQLSVSLLHRFRQDGIERAPNVVNSPGVIPYSPIGFQFPKFRLLLTRLIPGNALNFPNDTLSREERCSLHFMLSSSFDKRVRGDEGQVCNKLSQYRASQRLPRSIPSQLSSNFMGDVELLENFRRKSGAPQSNGKQARQAVNPNPLDFDFGWNDVERGYNSNDGGLNSISQCPVENGVIWTPWGTVSAGTLIAGIAAGLQQQNVQLRTLLALARRRGDTNLPQSTVVNVDNRWAATLAGDLAEVALVQVPVSAGETASVGSNGAWNSTVMPKWYFLSQRQNMEMTDAEIRGGLDGLILAMNVSNWRTQASNLKLSQLLRMYYSMDGVLDSGVMACNRKEIFPNVAPFDDMVKQSSAFAQVLDREMQLRVTLRPDAIHNFSVEASKSLTTYVPQYLNDLSCSVSNALPQDISSSITPMTNIYVFLDASWQYNNVVDYLVAVLNGLNIYPYASSVTLLCASDGSVIVNTTHQMPDVYQQWNVTTHSLCAPGFNLPTILRTVQNLTQSYMNEEKQNSSVGGRSLVSLLMPYIASVNSGDSSYAETQLQTLYEKIPDLYFVYYTGGSLNRFNSFVRKPSEDLFALNYGSNVAASANPVVMRITKIPRRIINPRCGSNFYTNSWGTDSMIQYVQPGKILFYKVSPNYFFGQGNGRYVGVQTQNAQTFTVCSSRSVAMPMSNDTSSGNVNCAQVGGNSYNYDLSNSCKDYYTIHQCPPLYLSVTPNTTYQTVSCSQDPCQTPDQMGFTVSVVNMGCFSSASGLLASFLTITMAYLLLQLVH